MFAPPFQSPFVKPFPSEAAAAAFAPTDISTLRIWIDKSDISTLFKDAARTVPVTADGDAILGYADKSGYSNHATATSGALYKTNIQNGLSAALFNGTSNFYSLPNLSALTAAEIFLVLKIANDPPATDPKTGLWHMGTSADATHFPYTDSTIYDSFGTTARKTTVNPSGSLASWHCYNVISASGEWTSRRNTTQLHTTASNTVGFPSAPRIGAFTASYFLDGYIGEMFLFNAKLSTGDRSNMDEFVRAKWSLY